MPLSVRYVDRLEEFIIVINSHTRTFFHARWDFACLRGRYGSQNSVHTIGAWINRRIVLHDIARGYARKDTIYTSNLYPNPSSYLSRGNEQALRWYTCVYELTNDYCQLLRYRYRTHAICEHKNIYSRRERWTQQPQKQRSVRKFFLVSTLSIYRYHNTVCFARQLGSSMPNRGNWQAGCLLHKFPSYFMFNANDININMFINQLHMRHSPTWTSSALRS